MLEGEGAGDAEAFVFVVEAVALASPGWGAGCSLQAASVATLNIKTETIMQGLQNITRRLIQL